MLKKLFDFFVFTSLFIAVCAVLMVYQTTYIFRVHMPMNLVGFVFFGSVCSYNFHWYLTPPNISNPSIKTKWNINYKYVHLALFICGLIGSAVFTLYLIQNWFWLMITAFLTFMYSAPKISFPFFIKLRKIAIGKTIFLAFAWTHITALLPLIISENALTTAQIWYVINRFFYIYAICIIFDRRDVEEDRKAGIKSLITYLDKKSIDYLFWFIMIAFSITLFILYRYIPISVFIGLLVPGIILSLLYNPSKVSSSDYLYYFFLDGMMMLPAPLILLL